MKATRVDALARQANMDLDEAMVTLWEAGLDYVEGPLSLVPARDMKTAVRALGIEIPSEQLLVSYWVDRTGLSREELALKLAATGVRLSANTRKIPKNSLRRLKQMAGESPATHSPTKPSNRPLLTPVEPLDWRDIGSAEVRAYLEFEDILAIHEALEHDFAPSKDPISPPGVRDINLLASAVERPRTGIGNVLKYPTAEMAAAALFHSVALNHGFHNGNKRTALVALLAVLDANDLVLTCSEDELFRFTLKVAAHALVPAHADLIADREVLEISKWIKTNSRRVERGERTMKWLRLKQRLRELGCEMAPPAGVGNRLNIWRTVQEPRRLGRPRHITLTTQVACAGDGTDADRNTLHKIRKDLCLDDEHDVDSATFYGDSVIDSFIIDYRRILRRLAKL